MPEYWIRRAITVLVTPVGLALISATRLLIISNYNVTTAVTVAESGGYVNTFLGSLIPLVPAFMPYLALLLLAFRRFILCTLTIAATALISPVVRPPATALRYFDDYWISTFHWIYIHLAYAAVIVLGIWIISLRIPWRDLHGHWMHGFFRILWACAAVFALIPYFLDAYPAPSTQNFYASYLRQPWLTAEQISVDPSKIYQGYVLASDDQWMTVLLFQSRTIAYFRAGSVTARIVCQSPAKPSPPPLVRLLNVKGSSLRECRSADSWAVAQHAAGSAGAKARNNSKKAATPIRSAEGRVAPPRKPLACCRSGRYSGRRLERYSRRSEWPFRYPRKAVRLPTPPARFYHRHGMAAPGRKSTHRVGGSARSQHPSRVEVLSGELFLLCAAYRDKSAGDAV
jgi:hypothetical protein